MTKPFYAAPDASAAMREFYARLAQKNAAPLWEALAQLVTPEPVTLTQPAHWSYSELRPLLLEAGQRISAEQAERRVLVLENPGLRGSVRITESLYAGLQLVLPGEIARSHRHQASALRFVLESNGGFTAVEGERAAMQAGDFILTPSWAWHDHGNLPASEDGAGPAIWLDGLDIPLVNSLSGSFAEHYPAEQQPLARPEGDAQACYAANMLPLEYRAPRLSSPVFAYPYARSRAALQQLYQNGPLDATHGIKLQYVNPATGGAPLPTIGAFLQLLPAGFSGAAYRSSDATIYCVAEGSGSSRVGAQTFAWQEHDVFVVPNWQPVAHSATSEAVLFSFSDRPVQKALGLWREQAL
ncbi:MAG: gentisate 1,2-dioxygenase [Acidobacteria bacterium]|nr:gentisate 1,2-dioxygenase [Acidobacteriota bacterium]MBI3425424.1 gentisate 1,2-dioxygenase [Acidobacteriota bacterium]